MDEKVVVVSNKKGMVSITLPNINLRRTWPKKGTKISIPKNQLEEAMYEPGVEYMFKTGMLYIEKMQDKIDLGLEPEDATTPENIIIMTDEEKALYMSPKKQAWELEEMLKKLSYEGKKDFCDYVVENELLDGKKTAVIKKVCGVNVLTRIQLKQANEE